jgi:hypothetical protein
MAPGGSSTWQQTWSVRRLHSSATGSGSRWPQAVVSLSYVSVSVAVAPWERTLSPGCPVSVQQTDISPLRSARKPSLSVHHSTTFHRNTNIYYPATNRNKLCKIWGFHGGDYEEWCLLGCYRVALVRTDVSEELSTSFIRVTRIGELGQR